VGSVSTQALALLIVLSPGFIFLVGFNLAPARYPSRQDGQPGTLTDAALFAVTSAGLHITAGVFLFIIVDPFVSCSLFDTFAALVGLPPASGSRCSTRTIAAVSIAYSLLLSGAAFYAGRAAGAWVARTPRIFQAIHGQHYEVFGDGEAHVIADVMTNIVQDGRFLMYEGRLVELSLNGTRGINYVVLAGAHRFYMTVGAKGSSTTPRHMFRAIDANWERSSRLTIPGDRVVNLVTRTDPILLTDVPITEPPSAAHLPFGRISSRRRMIVRVCPRWLRRLFRNAVPRR